MIDIIDSLPIAMQILRRLSLHKGLASAPTNALFLWILFVTHVHELRVISQKRIADASVASAHVAYLSEDIVALRQEI